MIDQVQIRAATRSDVPALVEFSRRIFQVSFAADNTPDNMLAYLDASFSPALQSREIEDSNTRTTLALTGGELIAYSTVCMRDSPEVVAERHAVQLHRFYVDTPWHGTGLADRLMRAVDDAAVSLGGTHIWLAVWEHNPRAIRYYLKQGFDDLGTMPFTLGGELQTDRVLMREVIA